MFCRDNFCSRVQFVLHGKCRHLTISCILCYVACFCGNEILLGEVCVCVCVLAQCGLLFFRLQRSNTLLPTDGRKRREFLHTFSLSTESVCTVNSAPSYLKVNSPLRVRSCSGYRMAQLSQQSAAHVRSRVQKFPA
jgi:hypothetical protein